MSKSVLLALSLPLGLLAGCAKEPTFEEVQYPVLALGQASLEFGEVDWGGSVERTVLLSNDGAMPMGIASIDMGDVPSGEGAFTVAYTLDAMDCPEPTAAEEEAAAKAIDVDTGGGPRETGGGDTGEDEEEIPGDALFVLDPGCQLPLVVTYAPVGAGDAYDALVVTTVGTDVASEADENVPVYSPDPIHNSQVVYLHGESEYLQGTIVVRPRSFDFGYVHPNAAAEDPPTAHIQITNVGDGAVSVNDVISSDTCDAAFSVYGHFPGGILLEGDQSTLAEVTFTPTGTRSARCEITILTDDPANPEIGVSILGNSGSDLLNHAPTVAIRSPESGYRYSSHRPFELELNVFDLDQPANTLDCRVKSGVLLLETIASCTPSDESGHVMVEIPAENLQAGTDTIVVTVTDGSMVTTTASLSVLINAEYPADDDDGDGYGISGDPADCDDTSALTFPAATEVFDLADNDCDGVVDEGTDGYDDDDDGFAEVDGDCNDTVATVNPDAAELDDGLDNDCNGSIDETTTASDDDGDGYTENDWDCDDDNPDVHPGATEICDGYDNDCDGLRDSTDGCIATEGPPLIVGNRIRMDQTACLEGETVAMSVLVHDADGDAVAYQWSASDVGATFDNSFGASVNVTCPEIPGEDANTGKPVTIYTLVLDTDGEQDYGTAELAVWDANTKLYDPYKKPIYGTGCSSTGGSPVGTALLVAGALLGLTVRRRRE